MRNDKLADKIALFVQNTLREKPMRYIEVREKVMNEFNLSKCKSGNMLHLLDRRGNFLSLRLSYRTLRKGIIYLPQHSEEARRMFKVERESIPYQIRYANKTFHKELLSEAKEVRLKNRELPAELLIDVVKWKLKVCKPVAKRLLKELGVF